MLIALLSIWTWLEILLVIFFGFFGHVVVFALTRPFDPRRVVAGRYFRGMGIVAARLTPMWSFATFGQVPRSITPRTVVVSNHESHADPFLISHLPWEMKWLGKEVLFKFPFFGWSLALAGDIPVSRGDKDSAQRAMQQCTRWLDRGMPVMIFPEGTRSKTQELLPFKDGAFRLAIEAKADVLPIAVSGTRSALPKHSWRFGFSRARVTVGTPLSTRGMTLADVELLKARAREQILSLRDAMAAASPEPAPSLSA